MDKVTYQDLVARYGDVMAFDLLLSIEKLAKVGEDIHQVDEGARFQRALEALDKIDFAAC